MTDIEQRVGKMERFLREFVHQVQLMGSPEMQDRLEESINEMLPVPAPEYPLMVPRYQYHSTGMVRFIDGDLVKYAEAQQITQKLHEEINRLQSTLESLR